MKKFGRRRTKGIPREGRSLRYVAVVYPGPSLLFDSFSITTPRRILLATVLAYTSDQ
jgi:hypothetical protein